MGQVQSEAAAAVDSLGEQLSPAVTPQSDSHATSSINLDSLIAGTSYSISPTPLCLCLISHFIFHGNPIMGFIFMPFFLRIN